MKAEDISISAKYDARYSRPNCYAHRRAAFAPLIRSIVRRAGLSAATGPRVLDVGCGQGFFSGLLAECGCWVTGADVSTVGIEAARRQVRDVRFAIGDAFEIGQTFDAVFVRSFTAYNVADFATNRKTTERLFTLVKPGGVLIWLYNSTLHPERSTSWRYHRIEDVWSHFAPWRTEVFFTLRYETRLIGLSLVGTGLAEIIANRFGVGGELVAIARRFRE